MEATIGHNISAALPEVLAETHRSLIGRIDEVIQALAATPKTITSDADSGICSDTYKRADDLWKEVEALRVGEKAPYLTAERAVDGFFDPLKKKITTASGPVHNRVTSYMLAKKQEAERRAREERDRALAEAKRLQDEADERERQAALAREQAAAARKPANVEAKSAQAAGLESRADQLRWESSQRLADANRAEEAIAAPAAGKARTRGHASLSTLQQVPDFEVLDYEAIPLEALRPYLAREAIDKACKSFLMLQKKAALAGDGTTAIPGVRFFMTDRAIIR